MNNNIGKLIIFMFIFIIIFCIGGSFFVFESEVEIKEEDDILAIQNKITNIIDVYGYTIDNPNIIIDPYNMNYNTALIIFETDDYVSFNVNVNDMYNYNSKSTNKHYIGVYNLINGSNTITLSCGNIVKKIEININEEGNIFKSNILLSNNHFLVPTDKYVDDGIYTGVREVDILGKIYYEYLIEDGYKGIACEIDDERLAILSNKLLVLDRQNGDIISSFDISLYKYNWINMKFIDDRIVLYSDEVDISIDSEGNIFEYEGDYYSEYLLGDINYNTYNGIRFYKEIKTEKSDISVLLLNYDKKNNYNIEIKKEFNRIVVSGEDIEECNSYIILEQLFDKRVYELCDSVNYIYTYDFNGKYSIYFKNDDKIYKLNKYLEF